MQTLAWLHVHLQSSLFCVQCSFAHREACCAVQIQNAPIAHWKPIGVHNLRAGHASRYASRQEPLPIKVLHIAQGLRLS